jgi:transposase
VARKRKVRKPKIREIVRHIRGTTLPDNTIAAAVGVAPNTVRRYRALVFEKGFELHQLDQFDDRQLEIFFNKPTSRLSGKRIPDWQAVHDELQQDGMTLVFLWEEYCKEDPSTAYSYAQYAFHFHRWRKRTRVSMWMGHRPGESVFVDFAGDVIWFIDPKTGKSRKVQLFVACLGSSNLIFAYAVSTQGSADWIEANIRMLEYIDGVPERIVPDNLKAAIAKAGPFAIVQRTYQEMATHYHTSVVPARPDHPQDKAPVENAVLILKRWMLMRLRKMRFFSIDEINQAIAKLLEDVNNRPFKKFNGTRRSRFEALERQALRPLPSERFQYAEWVQAQLVPPNYLVRVKGQLYSVPYALVGESVEARVRADTVDILHHSKCVASHARDDNGTEPNIHPDHRHPSHRFVAELTPVNMRSWAKSIGPNMAELSEDVYASHSHHQPATKFLLAIKRLAENGLASEALEAAAAYARERQIFAIDRFRSIAKRQAKGELMPSPLVPAPTLHSNLRGASAYR